MKCQILFSRKNKYFSYVILKIGSVRVDSLHEMSNPIF